MRKYILLLSVVVSFASCSDFLDKELQGSPSKENYFQTTYQLQEALNAVYDILQSNSYNNCDWIFGEACGDDVQGNDEGGTNQIAQLVNFTFNTSNTWIRDRYTINYEGINRANQVIANAHRVKLPDTKTGSYRAIRQIVGQAKFLRALYYFNLVKTYGGVPIRPEEEDINKLAIPRSTKEEVYAYIEKDLREAAVMLPSKFTDATSGKVGCGAATALLMKVLMYQATPGVESEKWEEIVRLGEYFVDGNPYTYADILHLDNYDVTWEELRENLWFLPKELLLPTDTYEEFTTPLPVLANEYSLEAKSPYDGSTMHYRQLFHETGEFCTRSVFEIVFKESANGMNDDLNEGTGIFQNLFMVRLFASTSFKTAVSSDPRKDELILDHAAVTFDGERLEIPPGRTGFMRWYTPRIERPENENDNAKNRRVIIYPEVVLIYAEALNETDDRMKALEQLNKIKTVANKINGSSTLYQPGTYTEMRNQIWTERRIELCSLWDRFFDIVRQGRAAQILHDMAKETTWKRGMHFVEGINEIFPIPQNEIDITNNVVTQNPGY